MKKRFRVSRLLTRAQHCFVYAEHKEEAQLLAEHDIDANILWHDGKVSDEEITGCTEMDDFGREVR